MSPTCAIPGLTIVLKRKQRTKRSSVALTTSDQRRRMLRVVGLELLAEHDLERVSVEQLARQAGCSVGAFYYRFPDKNAYLKWLISSEFLDLEHRLLGDASGRGRRKILAGNSLFDFISRIMKEISNKQNAGVVRAALKLGATDAEALSYYERYREAATDVAVKMFSGGTKKKISEQKISEAVQIVFSAVNDAALMPNSCTMKLGSRAMVSAVCGMAASHIGVKADLKGRNIDSERRDVKLPSHKVAKESSVKASKSKKGKTSGKSRRTFL